MKAHSFQRLLLPAALLLAMESLYAADGPAAQVAEADATTPTQEPSPTPDSNGRTTTFVLTPKLIFYDYFSGYGPDRTQFLERYNFQRGIDGDSRSDFWIDADFRLMVSDSERDLLTIERISFGRYNHRNTLRADREQAGITAYFRQFGSASGGLDYLFSPGQVDGGIDRSYFFPAQTNTNSGYLAQYTDDTGNRDFNIKRSNYGVGVKIKPSLLEGNGSLAVKYDGYQRQGRQLFQYILGGNDIRQAGTNAATNGRVLHRWRSFDQQVDDDNQRVSLTAMVTPGDLFQLAYDFSVDRYENNASNGTHADVNRYLPPQWQYDTTADSTRPLGFVADNHLLSHGLRFSTSFADVAVAAGYGQSRLEQDTFTQPQQRRGFDTGRISTENAFLNLSTQIHPRVSLDGFYKFYQRDNDSSFPVFGLLDPAGSEQLGVRINRISSDSYGLSSGFRSRTLKTSFLLGWKHEDKQRDLTFHDATLGPPAVNGISAERSFYSERTEYDEVTLRMISQPGKRFNLRITPSYLWASHTALVTDPREQFKLKTSLTYTAEHGTFVNGYFNYANKRNNDHTLLGTDGVSVTQDMDRVATSAGVSVSLIPSEWVTAQVGFGWLQDDFSALFFGANRRRFEAPGNPTVFYLRDGSNYNIDTYVFNAGSDWQASDATSYSASYTFSRSAGNTASGLVLSGLPRIDGTINNSVSSLSLGVQYQASPKVHWSANYTIEHYNNEIFDEFSGGLHSVTVGMSYAF